mmetsp:Transcript_9434/g.25237  ORF Transcript_9434/g.25237 Transcript_9434/m.25237 type:complete len:276 (-) Transcript_9434:26-853(-)
MMRSHILLLVACTNSLNFSPRRVHLRKLLRRKNRKPKRPTMLRNQDRPELLLFVTTNAARWTDGVERPGVARLVAEAKDAGTPSIWICEDDPKPVGDLKPTPWPNAPSLPCPQALQDARASIEIEPDGFGGGMGGAGGTRGRKMPAREPLPARCVVIAPSREAAIAGRSAGMRVVGLCSEAEVTLDGAADVLFDELDDDWDAVTFDDLYTPGSYWVNPPSPRTVDGRHADPWTGEVVEYDMSGAVVSAAEAEDESVDDGELSAAERAILADIEGL